MRSGIICLVLAGLAGLMPAQRLDLSSLDKLKDKAKESANIELGKEQLGMASGLIPGGKQDTESMRGFLSGLNGVYVRSFEFEKAGEYSTADLDPIRKQLQSKAWSRIVEVQEKDELVEVYVYNAGKPDQAMTVFAAEDKELVVVNILGVTDLSKLGALGGLVKIPQIQSNFGRGSSKPKPPAAGAGKKQEE